MNKLINRRTLAAATFFLSALLFCVSTLPASAQDGNPPPSNEVQQNAGNQAPDLIGILGLTPDQRAKIRAIRERNKEERQLTTERLRNAQQALDEAIYADDASEAVVEERARELAAAQTANMRLRALTELSIRRVLTPEQLNALRALRLRQAERRRLEREMGLPRRLRNRPQGNVDGQAPLLPRERLRQRQNNPEQQNDLSRPAAGTRERRGQPLRGTRP